MLRKHVRCRPKMRWLVQDCTALKAGRDSFDTVVDKGALDALTGDPDDVSGLAAGQALLHEASRVCSPVGGRVCVVSLLQPHVLQLLLRTFRSGWDLALHRVVPPADMATSPLHPYLAVATASSAAAASAEVLRADDDGDDDDVDACVAALDADEVEEEDAPVSRVALFAQGVPPSGAAHAAMISSIVAAENEARARGGRAAPAGAWPGAGADRWAHRVPGTSSSEMALRGGRFTARVVDAACGGGSGGGGGGRDGGPVEREAAVFLVPQGREGDFLFGTRPGRAALAASCRTRRLVLVAVRAQRHASGGGDSGGGDDSGGGGDGGGGGGGASDVQAELSPLVTPLLPASVRGGTTRVPFLTTNDGLGERKLVASYPAADGSTTGEIRVEEVRLEASPPSRCVATLRRLVFASNPRLVQSEARLVEADGRVDTAYLSSAYHACIVAGLAIGWPSHPSSTGGGQLPSVMVIGLGGGCLPTFLRRHAACSVPVVELDASVAAVAKAHFGFAEDDECSLSICDGLVAVASSPRASLHAIIVDAASDDPRLGMSCPPAAFVALPFLLAARDALAPGGVLVINVVARSKTAFANALVSLRAAFPHLQQADAADDLNRVVFARAAAPVGGAGGAAARFAAAAAAAGRAPWDAAMELQELVDGVRTLTVAE